MSFWAGRRVLVTGASGFIDSHLVEALLAQGARVRGLGRSRPRLEAALGAQAAHIEWMEGDLTLAAVARTACSGMEMVCHLAGHVGGIGQNAASPSTMLVDNVRLGLPIVDAAARAGVDRLLCVSSACVYPGDCTIPTPESEGFAGDPEATNFGYGWAKRLLEVQARAAMREFGMNVAIVRPYNAYGPRDHFELQTGHVIPALIRKVLEGDDPLIVWGDGTQTRSFLYVTDLVEGLLRAVEQYAVGDPVNLGTEEEITTAALAQLISELCGRAPEVRFDPGRPSGQARRRGDLRTAREQLGFAPRVGLREGLGRTIEWYMQQRILSEAGAPHAR